MSSFPNRVAGCVTHETHDGILVTNPATGLVTWLNRTAAIVYLMCNGQHDAAQMSGALQHLFDLFHSPRADVDRTLAELHRSGLIDSVAKPEQEALSLMVSVWAPSESLPRAVMTHLDSIRLQCERSGISFRLIIENQADRALAKNRAASAVLSFAQYSHVLFVDASSDATAEIAAIDLSRILRSGHGVVGIPVPSPGHDFSRVAAAGLGDPAQLEAISRTFNVAFQGVSAATAPHEDFVEARFVSSSALCVSRSALELLAGSAHVRRYRGLIADNFVEYLEHMWGFFDVAEMAGNLQVSHDVAFCERWRANGGAVMVDLTGSFGAAVAASRAVLARTRASS